MDIDAMEKALAAVQQEQPPDNEEMDDEQKSEYKQWLEEQLDWPGQGKGKGGKGGEGGRDGGGKGGKDTLCNYYKKSPGIFEDIARSSPRIRRHGTNSE